MRKNILYLLVLAFVLSGCEDNLHFQVNGDVRNGENEMVYIEEINLDKINILDSFRIKSNGNFHFKIQRPVYPDFYRIRIKDRYIIFNVDSTETVTIKASEPEFVNYSIKGSETIRKISELRQSVKNLEKAISEYEAIVVGEERREKQKELNLLIRAHKQLAERIIYEDTRSSAAYFAVFHKVNNLNFFDIRDDNHLKNYVAVATAYNAFYPHSVRGKRLTDLISQAKQYKRSIELKRIILDSSNFNTIDVTLPDVNGKMLSVSDFKGKVLMVSFTNYAKNKFSIVFIYTLMEVYQKYHEKGFEIYGISFDDYDYFKNTAKDFPWVRIFDKDGFNTPLFRKYDIEYLPTLFLLDRSGKIVSRHNYVDESLLYNIERLVEEKDQVE